MNYDKNKKIPVLHLTGALVLLLLLFPAFVYADQDFSFDLDEFEKKPLEWGGFVEFKWDHIDLHQGAGFSRLNSSDDSRSTLDRITGSLQLDGRYNKGITTLNWLLKASAQQDDLGWMDTADIYEAYVYVKPSPHITAGAGKKSYKWGKGYAWNPVGFINRVKDPNNPEEAMEGFTTLEVDLIKSFTGSLQTVAFTSVVLPVWQGVNEDFGVVDNINLAAKLYLLYRDTDIDFLYYTGNSRSTSYGFDFSRNLATNFEIHGELAYISSRKQIFLQEDDSIAVREGSALTGLAGVRYLSESDITSIVEYYYNGGGYSVNELKNFYQFIDSGAEYFFDTGNNILLDRARELSFSGYGRPYLGRNYLYAKFTKKEPFDILYFTPGLTAIVNLDDLSSSISPEFLYVGFTNWEFRVRFSLLNGGNETEYGEKQNSSKLEVRVRYFF